MCGFSRRFRDWSRDDDRDLCGPYLATAPSRPARRCERIWLCTGQALFRTRTGDPFLTMEVLYQLS